MTTLDSFHQHVIKSEPAMCMATVLNTYEMKLELFFSYNFVNEWQNIDEMVYDHDGLICESFGKDQSWNVEKY